MKSILAVVLAAAAVAIPAAPAGAQSNESYMGRYDTYTPSNSWQTERMGTPSVTPNGYGLGVNTDTYGRPHTYRTQDGTAVDPIFQGGVKRDGYGAGVHMDQFGRPVYDSAP